MQVNRRWLVMLLIVASLQLSTFVLTGCGAATEAATEEENKAVTVEPIAGTDLNNITLSEEAIKRLDLQTSEVAAAPGAGSGAKQMAIPYGAVLYDVDGNTWAYTKDPAALTFVRAAITVDHIEGDLAILTDGPFIGTAVVSVGATELYGSESEFEEE
jgi:uncharacterized protein YcfL